MKNRRILPTLGTVIVAFSLVPVGAQTVYWDTNGDTGGSGNTGGAWNSGTNWTTDALGELATQAWVDGNAAVFSAGADGTGSWTVTIDGTIETPSILFSDTGTKTITGGIINIGGGSISSTGLPLTGADDIVINSVLAGSGGLTIAAHGDATSDGGGSSGAELRLNGANTFSGGFTVTRGVVSFTNSDAFGDPANTITLDGGGILMNSGSTTALPRDIIAGPAGGSIRLYGGANVLNHDGSLTGSTSVRRTDGGLLNMNGDGSGFTGTWNNRGGDTAFTSTDWSQMTLDSRGGGRVFFPNSGTTTVQSVTNGRDIFINNGGRLDIASGALDFVTGAGFWIQTANSGALTTSNGTLTVTSGSPTGNLTTTIHAIRVVIEDESPGNPLTLVKNNNNITILDRVNTYTGGTIINGGRINTDNTSAFGTGTVTVNAGGQAWLTQSGAYANNFVINGTGVTEGAGDLGAIRFSASTLTGDVNVASDARITADGSTGTLTGALTGSADLGLNAPDRPGTLTLSGDISAYTGTMTLNAGTLNLSGALGGTLAIGGGATANLNAGTEIGTPVFAGGVARTLNLNTGATINGDVITDFFDQVTNVNVAGTITGDVLIDDSSTLGLRGGSIGGNLTTGFDGGSMINWNLLEPLSVQGNLTTNGTQIINLIANPDPGSPATVLSYDGTFTGSIFDFQLANEFNYRSVDFQDTGTAITVSTGSDVRTWVGDDATNPTFWDAFTPNWAEGDNLFFNGDAVIIDDTAVSTTIAMQDQLAPASVTFNNTTSDFTVTGGPGFGLTGAMDLTKNGSGALTLGGAGSTFSGAVAINDGVLNITNEEALGFNSGITVASGARVNLNGQAPSSQGRHYTWTIAGDGGDGPGGLGAITNTGGGVFTNASILNLILADDAEIGGNNGRFDFGRSGGNAGTITGNGFTLTKIGNNQVVARGEASNISYVVNEGMLTFEDVDSASGTETIIVNGGTMNTWGPRTLVNDVELASGTTFGNNGGALATWTGTITTTGTATVQTAANLLLSGELAGDATITRAGGNTLFLENTAADFTGKIVSTSGGTLRIASADAIGTATGADVLTLGGGVTLQGGTSAGLDSLTIGSTTQGIAQTGNVNYDAGAGNTLTIDGPISGTGNLSKANNSGTLTFNQPVSSTNGNLSANGGTVNINQGVTLTTDDTTAVVHTLNGNVTNFNGGNSNVRRLQVSTGTLNIGPGNNIVTNSFESSQGGNTQSVINQTGGSITVTGNVNTNDNQRTNLFGHWGSGATTVYNMSGGEFTSLDAFIGLGWDAANTVFNQTGGIVNARGIGLGGRNNPAQYNLEAGHLNLGDLGVNGTASEKQINLGGGTLGALADWSSAQGMVLTGTGGDVTINTLDAIDGTTPRTITMNGPLTGSGGFIKDGEGNLVLNNPANDFTGTAEVVGGTLFLNGAVAFDATVRTSPGGNIRPGTNSATGSGSVGTLDMAGGNVTFRVGASTDVLNADEITVSDNTTISIIPSSALTTGQEITIMTYSGTIGGLGTAGIILDPIANPNYTASLDFSEAGVIKLIIDSADTLTWTGDIDGTWDVDTTANWKTDSDDQASNFFNFDVVTFDDGGDNTAITLAGPITPASVLVNATQNYSFSGDGISGETSIIKDGSGALTLGADNFHSGGVTLNAGTLNLGSSGATGSGTLEVNAGTLDNPTGAALTVNGNQSWNGNFSIANTNDLSFGSGTITTANAVEVNVAAGTTTINSALAATNNITKTGSGVMTLNGSGSGNGIITVSEGTMNVNTDHGERRYIVGAGATLNLRYTRNPNWGYSYGLLVNGNGVTDPAGVYFLGGTSHRFAGAGGLNFDTAPSTARTIDSGNVTLIGGDINATHLTVNAAASGSVLVPQITLDGANFGYRMNIIAGDNTASGDLVINGPLIGGGSVGRAGFPVNFQKFGTGSVVLNAVSTYNHGLWIREGEVVLGGNNRLPTATGVAFGDGAGVNGTLVLNGHNQTLADIGIHNTNTESSIVGRSSTQSTLTVNYGGDGRTFNGILGGPATNDDNLALVKIGGGQLTLAGANTYAGNTTVDGGTLTLGTTGQLRFVPTANGVSNSVTGTATVQFEGAFNIDLSAANLTDGNSWMLVDVASLSQSFAGTFSVTGFTRDGAVHTLVDGANTWTFDETTGMLTLAATATGSDFDDWAASFGISGGPNDDENGDGLTNFFKYAFGLDPNDASSISPVTAPDVDSGTFTYTRRRQDLTGLTYSYEYSTTLAGWNPLIPLLADTTDNGDPVETITVTIPASLLEESKFFIRVGTEQ